MRERSSIINYLLHIQCRTIHSLGSNAPLPGVPFVSHRFVKKACVASVFIVTMTTAIMLLAVLSLCLSYPLTASPVGGDRVYWKDNENDIDYRLENDLSAKFQGYHIQHINSESRISEIKSDFNDNVKTRHFDTDSFDVDDYDRIAQHKGSPKRRLPEAIIIGVKKAGTRALLEFLRIHPDVRAPGPEPHFFDRYYDNGLEWYRKQMPTSLEGQLTMEKTPSYFITKEAPGRIRKMNADIKLILVVRDPVTRAISDYTQALSKRTDVKDFEDMAFVDNTTGIVDVSWGAIKIGVYAKHFDRWLVHFPLSQIHIVNGEKLIEEPAKEMQRVQSFLGLKTVINDKHFYFNATKGFPCLKKPEHSGSPHCLGRTKGRPHPHIPPLAIQRLKNFFRPFNQKFYQMVGEDFGWN